MQSHRLVIHNFAQISEAAIELRDLTVLVGAQGTGKSLILQWLKAAIDGKHIHEPVRSAFSDSLDLDEATRVMHPNDARWDYLLGHERSAQVIAVESHSAQTSEVSLVIAKRAASRRHLAGHLANGRVADGLGMGGMGDIDQLSDADRERFDHAYEQLWKDPAKLPARRYRITVTDPAFVSHVAKGARWASAAY